MNKYVECYESLHDYNSIILLDDLENCTHDMLYTDGNVIKVDKKIKGKNVLNAYLVNHASYIIKIKYSTKEIDKGSNMERSIIDYNVYVSKKFTKKTLEYIKSSLKDVNNHTCIKDKVIDNFASTAEESFEFELKDNSVKKLIKH